MRMPSECETESLQKPRLIFDKAMLKCLGEAAKADKLARAGDIAATFERRQL